MPNNFLKKLVKKESFTRFVLPAILLIALALVGYFSFKGKTKTISETQAKTVAENFVNDFLMPSGSKATVKDVSLEYGLYKLQIDIVSDVVESYLTRDGKLFFPQSLNVEEIRASRATQETPDDQAPAATVSSKSGKPVIELFVMSYCPYGTQIEKGFLPVLETLGDKIDFRLKFVDYAMHGEKELTENLLQHCIAKEDPDKLAPYLTCFLADGQSESCLDEAGVNQRKVDSCVADTDKEYKVSENYENKVGWQGSYPGFDVDKADTDKYNVGGSPTLVINGQTIQSNRDSQSLLDVVCSAFDNPPAECDTSLPTGSPTPGFGFETASGSTGAAVCN